MTSAQPRVNTNKQAAPRQKNEFLTLAHASRLSLRVQVDTRIHTEDNARYERYKYKSLFAGC